MIGTHAAAPVRHWHSCLFVVAVLLATLGLHLAIADHALAGTRATHVLKKTLDGSTTPAGSFSTPAKIAVDQASESVYVLDVGNNVIDKFDGAGNPQSFSALGTSALDGAGSGEPDQTPQDSLQLTGDSDIATDGAGKIYLASETELVSVFAPSGEFLFQFDGHEAPGESFGNACGIAVDSSGDIYVGGFFTGVNKFEQTGGGVKWVSQISPEELKTNSCDLAMGPGDNLYVNGYGVDVKRFKEDVFQNVADSGPASYGVTVNPADETLYVGRRNLVAQDEPSGTMVDEFGQGVLESVKGVGAVSAGDKVFISDSAANRVYVFGPETVPVPDVTLGAPTSVEPFAMTLNGTVDPSGAPTSWHFRYREQGSEAWTDAEGHEAGSGSGAVVAAETIEGLNSNTGYEFQVVATNTDLNKTATSATGSQTTAVAQPRVGATFVAPRTTTTVRLNGRVNPENDGTVYWFEYGPADCEGGGCESAPPTHDASAGAGLSQVLVTESISGLSPGTTYHYRLVVENSAGVTQSKDETFVTRTAAEMAMGARGIELVSNPDNGNNGVFGTLAGGNNLSADGNRAIWRVFAGAPGGTTGANVNYLAERGATGWTSRSLIPQASEQPGGGDLRFDVLQRTEDFKHFTFMGQEGSLAGSEATLVRTDDQQHLDLLGTRPPLNTEAAAARTELTADGEHLFYMNEGILMDYRPGGAVDLGKLPDGSAPDCGIEIATNSFYESQSWAALSDGSRVYFTTRGDDCSSPLQLYVRNTESEQTSLVSGPVSSGEPGETVLIRTNENGRKALYRTTSRLVGSDTNDRVDLYEYTEGGGNSCLTCSLPSITLNEEFKTSADLSRIYFVTDSILRPDQGGSGAPGTLNLYVIHGGSVDFVSELGQGNITLADVHSVISNNGRYLLFSDASHVETADDIGSDCDLGSGPEKCSELYLYDDADGSIECVSCVHGGLTTSNVSTNLARLSADGSTVAFRTASALVPADVNGTTDVYEWHNGALRLITDGVTKWPTGSGAPEVQGISADGSTILFTVAAKLTGFEQDGLANMYVARAGGGFTPPNPPAPCREDDCQGPLVPAPNQAVPGSERLEAGSSPAVKHRHRKRTRHKHKHKHGKHGHRHAHTKQGGSK